MAKKKQSVESLIEEEKWEEARLAIEEELKAAPEDHWLLTRLSTTYYEQRDYIKALQYAEQAKDLAPNCPLVLWDYAGALDMLGRRKEALDVYRTLLDRGAKNIAMDECGEGIKWARNLLMDCTYRAGCCVADLGHRDEAAIMMRAYLHLLDLGGEGLYPREEVAKKLRQLTRTHADIQETLRTVCEAMGVA